MNRPFETSGPTADDGYAASPLVLPPLPIYQDAIGIESEHEDHAGETLGTRGGVCVGGTGSPFITISNGGGISVGGTGSPFIRKG